MNKTAFKVGFLNGLARLGLTPSEFTAAFQKRATGALASGAGALLAGAASVPIPAAKALMLGGLAAPVMAGAGTGAAEAMLSSPIPEDMDTLRAEELRDTYRRMAKVIRERSHRHAQGNLA